VGATRRQMHRSRFSERAVMMAGLAGFAANAAARSPPIILPTRARSRTPLFRPWLIPVPWACALESVLARSVRHTSMVESRCGAVV
jgi:hypothetical protein